MVTLRAQLGLSAASVHTGNPGSGPFEAPGLVLQKLAALGQQLLGVNSSTDAINSSSGGDQLPPDVLVSAARQHLMSAAVVQLQLPQVELLLADYQHLAADECERQLLSRYVESSLTREVLSLMNACAGTCNQADLCIHLTQLEAGRCSCWSHLSTLKDTTMHSLQLVSDC